jgi:SAM-dependent methyltransferase
VTNPAIEAEALPTFAPTFEYSPQVEITHHQTYPSELIIPRSRLRRFEDVSADTPVPLEHAFHLLGDLAGKTVVHLGRNGGINTVILASLGAKVIAIEDSESALARTTVHAQANGLESNVMFVLATGSQLPVDDGRVDRVLCVGGLSSFDFLIAARQIRRILRPGGAAVFLQSLSGGNWFSKFKNSSTERVGKDRKLTREDVDRISRAVGRPGRSREFTFTTRVLSRWNMRTKGAVKEQIEVEAFGGGFKSFITWEARKEC